MGYVPPPTGSEQFGDILCSLQGHERATETPGPRLRSSGSPGQVLQLLGGMPTWCNVPQDEALPTKGPLVLRCGACGTKHVANTKRCDACGCPNRMEAISDPATAQEALLDQLRHQSRIKRIQLWLMGWASKPSFLGGTESSGPC